LFCWSNAIDDSRASRLLPILLGVNRTNEFRSSC